MARSLMYRVTNIPETASLDVFKSALSEALPADEKAIAITASLAPSVNRRGTNISLLSFSTPPKFVAPLAKGQKDVQIATSLGNLTFDVSFYGLTQLYPTAPGEEIVADIIAVTGLDGHAYGSWRGKGSLAKVWLRDFFATDLPNCRTMIFGYNTKLTQSTIHTIRDYKIDLLEQIRKARAEKEQRRRPLIFIAHSFGGIVVSQALVKAEEALESENDPGAHVIYQSTKAAMFFGTPHRGMSTTDIMQMINTETHNERADLVQSIRKDSAQLENDLQKFGHFAEKFKIFSCYETQKTSSIVKKEDGRFARTGKQIVVVTPEGASLSQPGVDETMISIDGDHSTMVKFDSENDLAYTSVLNGVREVIASLKGPPPYASEKGKGGLIEAIQYEDLDIVRKRLKEGVSAKNAKNNKGVSALHYAARTGNEEIIRELIKQGAEIQGKDHKGKSPADYARVCGHLDLAERLSSKEGWEGGST